MVGLLLPIVLALPQLLVASHNPSAFFEQQAERHLVLGAEVAAPAAHSHDHGAAAERYPNHLHGHNPADHTHDSAHPPRQAPLTFSSVKLLRPGACRGCDPYQPNPPKRPPRRPVEV